MSKKTLLETKITELLEELKENVSYDTDLAEIIEKLEKIESSPEKIKPKIYSEAQFLISTIRNRLLINKSEQYSLKKKTVAFLGLSVGSHAVNSWMTETRADRVKISDPDKISPSNLNRLNAGWKDVGIYKVDFIKERIKDINPYCQVYSYIDKDLKIIKNIIEDDPKVDLIVEQIDDLNGKLIVRKIAKKNKIPVIMATDVGDNVFLDIERYDISKSINFFNNRVPGIEKIKISELTKVELIELAIKLVGKEHNSKRMLESLSKVGKRIKTWPQLGTTATMAGSLITKTARKILLGEKVESGRYYFDYDEILTK